MNTVDWFLIGMVVLVIFVNIRSFMVLAQFNKQRAQLVEDTNAIHHSMEEFVTTLEQENEELYEKFVAYSKDKESKLEERIRLLENQLNTKSTVKPIVNPTQNQPVKEKEAEIAEVTVQEQTHEKIRTLSKQGFSPNQIAKVLQMDHGEVELVVKMIKSKQGNQK